MSRVLQTPVEIYPAFDPDQKPHPPGSSFRATWDTGATETVISEPVVQKLGLKPIGLTKVFHAHGEAQAEVYLVNLSLPNNIAFKFLQVTKGLLRGCHVLVGMDIISKGDFAVCTYRGVTSFTYRVPSCEKLDFVVANRSTQVTASAPRNGPCPCGSGKKYKRCCYGRA